MFRRPLIISTYLFMMIYVLALSTASADEPMSFAQSFGPRLGTTESEVQTLIDRFTEQLISEPYKADLYYHLARAYDTQGWHSKAAQYMRQWVRMSNSDVLVQNKYAFVVDEKNDKVLVVDRSTNAVIQKIDVGWLPKKAISTPEGNRVYVTNSLSNSVSSISTQKMSVVKTMKTGIMPWNGAPSPMGDRVYVNNLRSDNVSVIDTKTDTVVNTVPVGDGPWGIAVSPDGHKLYVSNQNSQEIQIIDTGSYSIVDVISVGTHPRDIALAPDESKLYAIDDDIASDEVEIYVIDLDNIGVSKAMNVPSMTDTDPLLSRFNDISLENKLGLLGNLKSGVNADGMIAKLDNQPPKTISSTAPKLSTAPLREREPETELPMGGPSPLESIEPLMRAHVKIPTRPSDKIIPMSEEEPEPAQKSESSENSSKRILRIIVVVQNDTLWRICMDNYGTTGKVVYKAIQEVNPAIKDVNKIYVGQQIRLPALFTDRLYDGSVVLVKPNDNLFRIALNNYGTVSTKIYDAILKANPVIEDITLIKVGQKIILPEISRGSS
jgi:YVTN family beta-propeller protein